MSEARYDELQSDLLQKFDCNVKAQLRVAYIDFDEPQRSNTIQWRLGLQFGGKDWQDESLRTLDARQVALASLDTPKGNGATILSDKFDSQPSKGKKSGPKVDLDQIIASALKVIFGSDLTSRFTHIF